jgi:hypothetical protein
MRAQSAALGVVAAAAFSSAASALPCAETALGQSTTSELTCTVSDQTSGPPARERQDDAEAGAPQDDSQPEVAQSAMFFDPTETADAENFAGGGIKITNLQATMTSNKYIAGRLPTAAETTRFEELIMLSPDYLSTKMLPHIRQRKPVGVGLVTVPQRPVKESDTTAPGQWFPQPKR